jgi:hypothetical protein
MVQKWVIASLAGVGLPDELRPQRIEREQSLAGARSVMESITVTKPAATAGGVLCCR